MAVRLSLKQTLWLGVAAAPLILLLLVQLIHLEHRDELFRDSITTIQSGNIAQTRSLLQQGAPSDGVDGAFVQGNPLCWAAQNGDIPMLRLLLQSGAHINKQSSGGETALMWAKNPQTLQYLLDAGANPLIRDAKGRTPWGYFNGNAEMAGIVKRGARKWRLLHPQGLGR